MKIPPLARFNRLQFSPEEEKEWVKKLADDTFKYRSDPNLAQRVFEVLMKFPKELLCKMLANQFVERFEQYVNNKRMSNFFKEKMKEGIDANRKNTQSEG